MEIANTEELLKLIDLSIHLEEAAARLYRIMSETHVEDSDFWWDLHMEEKEHAHILEQAKEYFEESERFPVEMIHAHEDRLRQDLLQVKAFIGHYVKKKETTRRDAFEMAIALERSVAEKTYDYFMKQHSDSQLATVFRKLTGLDKDHEKRIRAEMEKVLQVEEA